MRYLSVCSGIEAATVAWHPLGWEPAGFSEIDKFPSAVLAYHYPAVRNFGDFTTIEETDVGAIDLLVGGTPCQSFSVAGLRGGLGDDRGNLALEFCRLALRTRPRWLVWENVPGVLSSNGGRDFGSILGALAECGYGFAYRVLDAQFFGLAQRRKRVFVVGYLGDWRPAAAVLSERESLRRDTAPRRGEGKGVAALTSSGVGTCGADDNQAQAGHLIVADLHPTVGMLTSNGDAHSGYRDEKGLVPVAVHGTQDPDVLENMAHPLGRNHGQENAVVYQCHGSNVGPMGTLRNSGTSSGNGVPFVAFDLRGREGGAQFEGPHDTANIRAASGGSSRSYVAAMAVRRLTPVECARLQGFPDDYLDITYRGKPAADGPKYKALGNSMAVPCMRFLGMRIQLVEDILNGRD